MRHAADALAERATDPEVQRLLLGVLRDHEEDLQARKNAASSLTAAVRRLEGGEREKLSAELTISLEILKRDKAPEALVAIASRVPDRQ
jgi:hypothetical protein